MIGELSRLALLLMTGWYAAQPLLRDRFFGSGDGHWYLSTFQDFIYQARAGTFPAVVGQTEFSYNGFAVLRTLLVYYLGALLDALTLHSLGSVELLYGTVAACTLAAGLTTYCTLRALYPRRPWIAATAGVLYQMSPAVLMPIYVLDMIPTSSVVPFVPILVYGIIRFIRTPAPAAYVAIAGAMALILAGHAIIAIWCALITTLLLLAAVALRHRTASALLGLAITGGLFVALSVWYLMPLFSLGFGDDTFLAPGEPSIFFRESSFQRVWVIMVDWFKPQFLPIVGRPDAMSQQLGYGLWLFVLVGLLQVIRRQGFLELALLLAAFGVICVYLWPIPLLTGLAYRVLPIRFEATLWPHQRLYILLASISCAIGACAASSVRARSRRSIVGLGLVLIGIAGWSVSQAWLFLDFAEYKMSPASSTAAIQSVWTKALNPFSVAIASWYVGPVGFSGTGSEIFDPALDNAIIDRSEFVGPRRGGQGYPVPALTSDDPIPSNLDRALHQAEARPTLPLKNLIAPDEPVVGIKFAGTRDETPFAAPIFAFHLEPSKDYLLTYDAVLDKAKGRTSIQTDVGVQESLIGPSQPDHPFHEFLSLRAPGNATIDAAFLVQLQCDPASAGPCGGELRNFHLQTYNATELPIHITSVFPYRADVSAPTGGYLETHRVFLAGYTAHVNGVETNVFESPRGRVEIQLPAGDSRVELDYVGTPGITLGRAVSLIAWMLLAMWWVYRCRRHLVWRKVQVTKVRECSDLASVAPPAPPAR